MSRVISPHRIRIVLGLAILALISLLPSLIALLEGQLPFDEDVLSLFVPWRIWTAQCLQAGTLPLWNPYLFGGIPFMSNGQTSVLYLPNIIYWFLPVGTALFLDAFFHSVLLGCGGFLLARVLSRSHAASWLCAVCLMLGNGVAAHLYAGHMTWHAARAWLPWIIWALICFLRKNDNRYLWAAALLLALQVFAGYPPYVVWTVCWCLLFVVAWQWVGRSRFNFNIRPGNLLRFLLPAVLLITLSAAVVLPLAETSREGRRLTFADAMAGSSTFYSWVRLALPNFFGGNDRVQWSIEKLPHEEAAYIGLLPLCLALGSPLLWRRKNQGREWETAFPDGFQPQRFVNLFWWILPIAMVMALGENMPLYRFLFDHFPLFRLFRAPARWFEIWYFAACILAAFGFDAFICSQARQRKKLVGALFLAALVFVGIVIVIANLQPQSSFWMYLAQWNERDINQTSGERLAYAAYLRFNALQSAVIGYILAFTTAWFANRLCTAQGKQQVLWLKGLLAVLCVELTMLFWMSARFVADRPPQNPWTKPLAAVYKPGERWGMGFEGAAAEFGLNLGMPYQVDVFGGYDTMAPRSFFEFANAIEQRRFWSSGYETLRYHALWRVAGITHVPASVGSRLLPQLKSTGARPLARFGKGKNEISLWAVPHGWPRAFLTSHVYGATREKQLAVLGELAARKPPFAVVENGVFAHIVAGPAEAGAVNGLSLGINSVAMQVDAATPQVLVLNDTNAPGWHAWVNGQRQEIETVNYLFRGIDVPGGRSKVAFIYDNQTYRTSVFFSLCGLALLAGALSFAGNSRRKPPVR